MSISFTITTETLTNKITLVPPKQSCVNAKAVFSEFPSDSYFNMYTWIICIWSIFNIFSNWQSRSLGEGEPSLTVLLNGPDHQEIH